MIRPFAARSTRLAAFVAGLVLVCGFSAAAPGISRAELPRVRVAPPLLGPEAVSVERGPFEVGRTVALRLQTPSIVHIPAGEFVMGSNQDDLDRARSVCERDAIVGPVLMWSCARAFPPVEATRAVGSPCERVGIMNLTMTEHGRHRVLLGAFAIDRTEVTVLAYERCVSDGGCPRADYARSSPSFRGDSQPMVAVNWYEARAYCRWARGRLPTEAEWERVARGRDARVFPWGNVFNPRLANVGQAGPSCRSTIDGFEYTAPVGSFLDGASADGVLDLAGNVSEWVDDHFDDGPARAPGGDSDWMRSTSRYTPDTLVIAPHVTTASLSLRVFRGGSFTQGPLFARTTYRQRLGASERREWLGFRCAYDGR